jgi:hypothetical protein
MNMKLIYKAVLPVILTGLFFLLTSGSVDVITQDKVPFESDSAIIARHELEILVGGSIEEFSEHSFNSHLSRYELDSIMWADERMRIANSSITWSPDSAFRICTIQLESCGAYCNYEWMTWIHFNDGSGLVNSSEQFDEILGITQMDENVYLLNTTSYGRSGVIVCRSYEMGLISIVNHKVIYHRIADPRPYASDPDYTWFGVGFCNYSMDEAQLTFNPDKREILFHNEQDFTPFAEIDSISIYDGVLQYVDTGFVVKKYTEKRIKYIEPQ